MYPRINTFLSVPISRPLRNTKTNKHSYMQSTQYRNKALNHVYYLIMLLPLVTSYLNTTKNH